MNIYHCTICGKELSFNTRNTHACAKMSSGKELTELETAEQILLDYAKPNAFWIDQGNLFYAASVFKDALAELKRENERFIKTIEDAVQAVNTMQSLLMQSGLVTNSGAVSANIKLAFNRGAKFLSDNSEMQTAYLKNVYKQIEALTKTEGEK